MRFKSILTTCRSTEVSPFTITKTKGGFVLDKPYYLAVGSDTVDLNGTWKFRLGTNMKPIESQTFIRWKPGGLYNGMIAPLLNYAIKGVIWYQGESNTSNPSKYEKTFPAMTNNWRQKWGQGDFPLCSAGEFFGGN